MLNPEITVGNLVALGAAVIAAAAVLASLSKERDLRKKELADRVRQSTALVIAKLDRWKQLALQTFDELETAATDADGLMVSKCDEIATRDFFWKHVVAAQAGLAKSILEEEIEVAYSNLYGYDPRIHELFTAAVVRLRRIGALVFLQLLNRTQHDILTIRENAEKAVSSAHLGNRLRRTLDGCRSALEEHMESVVREFRTGMTAIVSASDDALVTRSIAVPPASILPDLAVLESDIYLRPSRELHSCMAFFESSHRSQFGSNVLEPWPLGVEFPEEVTAPKHVEA